jgi:hypothetical protein
VLSLYFGFQGKTLVNRPMGNDFVQFYAAGQILNQHQPVRIYDTAYLAQLEHEALPEMAPTQVLPFAYPPAVAQPFRALALLPYRWAYCAWLAFSMAVYATGLRLLFRKRVFGNYRRTAILLSVSTPVYLFETLIGGQISVMTFFAVALFVYCFENRWLALAGLALGFASYKPSLIAVPAALMILEGCWRMLAGLGTSAALMVLATVATAGLNGLWLWLIRLRAFSDLAASSDSALRRIKYVDLNSFFCDSSRREPGG